MTFIFYDTETTGLNPAFDQITQFAAIVTDDDFNVREELNLRCRLQPHVLASPGAMFVTGVGPNAISAAPMSCYEMVKAIRAFIRKWSPAVLIGFNSISYDENMLRQAFYQHLHPVYLTNTGGNSRMDILILAHAVAAHRPDAIVVPTGENGRPTFRLGQLVAANGIVLENAHDALADTRATLALAKFLKDRAPEVWEDVFACRSKALATQRLSKEDIVLFTDKMFSKATIAAGVICTSPDNPALHAMFDLSYDPALYLDVDLARAQQLLKSNPRPIRLLKANNLPIVRSMPSQANVGVDIDTARDRLARIKGHPTFSAVIEEALAGQYADQEPSGHIEQQIYGGFPSNADASLMERFHAAPWADRHGLAQKFEDDRYREFAERLIYAEAPDCLPAERKIAFDDWKATRHSGDEGALWMTVSKARSELEKLKDRVDGLTTPLYAEILNHYNQL
jgi:exodeoxyribonuclease-1